MFNGLGGGRRQEAEEVPKRPGPPRWGYEEDLWQPYCVNATEYSQR